MDLYSIILARVREIKTVAELDNLLSRTAYAHSKANRLTQEQFDAISKAISERKATFTERKV